MKKSSFTLFGAIVLLLSLDACKDSKTESAVRHQAKISTTIKQIETDKWLGQWNGPEGTFLRLSGGNGKYEITIQNLDGPQTYSGVSYDREIQFERNGTVEKIHATKGTETGMKWLNEKQNCLTIHLGEGFCRE